MSDITLIANLVSPSSKIIIIVEVSNYNSSYSSKLKALFPSLLSKKAMSLHIYTLLVDGPEFIDFSNFFSRSSS